MEIGLAQIFPKVTTSGISGVGFLFGCGTSKDAGYPLTIDLTRTVMSGLSTSQQKHVNTLLEQEGLHYDDQTCLPDIESICDLLRKRIESTQDKEAESAESRIREEILRIMLDCGKNHNLDQHIRFLRALKSRGGDTAGTVWIFTTNYDLLFELAGVEAEIAVTTGFDGSVERFFDPGKFDSYEVLTHGRERTVTPRSRLRVVLVKLHGSVAWLKRGDKLVESALGTKPSATGRSMILPRKTKVVETLEHPYDNLFSYSRRVVGRECKYILSCGFGFRDQHINDNVLKPVLASGKLRLVSLYGGEASDLHPFLQREGFHYVTPTERRLDGRLETADSDLWKFENLVQLLEQG